MVFGEDFVWEHIPKTGGDTTVALFKILKSLGYKLSIDDVNYSLKHKNHQERKISIGNKYLILNVRRLPYLILSTAFHFHNYDGLRLIDFKLDVKNTRPSIGHKIYGVPINYRTIGDDYVSRYCKHHKIKWIRCENLVEDFSKIMSKYFNFDPKLLEKAKSKKRNNYNSNIFDYWTINEIKQIYHNNPCWSNIENEVYGSLLC